MADSYDRNASVPIEKVEHISELVQLVKEGRYTGASIDYVHKYGMIKPPWSFRTAILYFNRFKVGDPIIWSTLAMGSTSNYRSVISNKKTWGPIWKDSNPIQFEKMQKYIPNTWSKLSDFEQDMVGDSIYVYKPVLGSGGNGVIFKKGDDMVNYVRELTETVHKQEFILQDFVDPWLLNGRKTHVRPITLFIVQPDGSREFYLYKRMKIFTAAQKFDSDLLMDNKDHTVMTITNLHVARSFFYTDPSNEGKEFPKSEYLLDAETALEGLNDEYISFEDMYSKIKDMHSVIYSIIGNILSCKATDVSIHDNSCFHIFASDVAFDKHGEPYFLEMNTQMAFQSLWEVEEIEEFCTDAAGLIRDIGSPYEIESSHSWERIHVE